MMQIGNAHYINNSGWYDVTITPAEGEPFEYTVAPDDDAEMAVAIRAIVEAQAPPIAAYVAPPPRVPAKVSAAQAKLALDAAAILDDVEAMIAAHPVRAVRIWFADANVWERSHPYLSALGLEMSLDDDAIDALFVAADRF